LRSACWRQASNKGASIVFLRNSAASVLGHARDRDGMLLVGGVRADQIADAFGTPSLLLDLSVLDRSVTELLRACEPHVIRISYAAKALFVTALARYLRDWPLGIDICSLGELRTAQGGGINAARLTMHGAGKSDEELNAAFDGQVGRVVVDGMEELQRVCLRADRRTLDVLLRINTGIEAHTHAFVRTSGDATKFGFAPRDLSAALSLLAQHHNLTLRGVHGHVGSQIFDPELFAENTRRLGEVAQQMRDAGFAPDTLVTGGGYGVPADPNARGIDFPAVMSAIAAAAPAEMNVEIEPGRALVAAAGTSLYSVLAVKRYERRTFAVVDGSMADNPRPALYGAQHTVVPVRTSAQEPMAVTICGRSCENDELAHARLPRDLRAGDLLAFCTTGAYTYSMASNYNRFTRPPIVALRNGRTELFTRRETSEDMLRLDC
jgi:diaminopimelate decarboxylase